MKHRSPRQRILVVEDQGVVATDIRCCLEDAGFEVTAIATTMEDALSEAIRVVPDLVLMDIRIQGSADGIEAAKTLHAQFEVPIIFLTAHDDADTLTRAKQIQPMAFLIKPFKPAELTSAVELALTRRRSEREVLERERSFLSAMDAIGDGVLTADAEGRVRFMNRSAEQLLGIVHQKVLGRPLKDVMRLLAPEGIPVSGLPYSIATDARSESSTRSQNARQRWITIRSTSIHGIAGSQVDVVVLQDVTEHRQAAETLHRQAALLDQSQEPIFTWELGGAVTYWNRAAEALYGFTAADVIGRPIAELLPETNDQDVCAALERDQRWTGELTRIAHDGRKLVVEALLIVVDEGVGGRTVLETDRDITERKRRDEQIHELNCLLQKRVEELLAVNRELDAFNYSVSHDLRAPLRHINGFAKLLVEEHGSDLPTEVFRTVERISEAARRMGRMIDALLDLSRTSRSEPAKQGIPLKPLVESVIDELKLESQHRQIDWRIADLPSTRCDPLLLRQVFVNLLSNAVKFTQTRELAVIEAGYYLDQGQTIFFVRDNGVGFSMQYAGQLFGVFQRLHRRDQFEGTGVGLVMVQRIIQKHGGRIWAEAELDRGATFFFTLAPPLAEESSHASLATVGTI